ncbi:hypothetical protein [Streptomyces sp. NPDC097640]|uniref:hypothetical protein n=1 Tax=Streptomyces sp. NPDC097640 TaxID=3157229 RepID=UPI0033186DCD
MQQRRQDRPIARSEPCSIIAELAVHVAAVALDAASGRLDPRPDSSAYGVQARLSSAHLVAAANKAVGQDVVHTMRVLPPGPATPTLAVGTAAAPPRAATDCAEASVLRLQHLAQGSLLLGTNRSKPCGP